MCEQSAEGLFQRRGQRQPHRLWRRSWRSCDCIPLCGSVDRRFRLLWAAGSAAGSALAQIIRRAVGRRRGRYLPAFALTGIILGVLLGNLIFLLFTGLLPLFSLPMLLFTVLAVVAAYPQLR